MTNEELIKRISDVAYDHGHDICYVAAIRIEKLQSKLDKAVAAMQALKDFDELPLSAKRPDVFERRVRHPILVALAEIKGE